jgi:hypothetical protein
MRKPLISMCCALLFVATQTTWGQAKTKQEVKLSYIVVIDQSPPQFIEVALPNPSEKKIKLQGGYTLTLSGGTGQASILSRLRSADGRVLHTRQLNAQSGAIPSVAYVVCSGKATHISPAPAQLPKCQS